jgi:hypothetical protein
MADSTTSKKLMRARASFALRYGLAFASFAGACRWIFCFTTSICLIRLLHLH